MLFPSALRATELGEVAHRRCAAAQYCRFSLTLYLSEKDRYRTAPFFFFFLISLSATLVTYYPTAISPGVESIFL